MLRVALGEACAQRDEALEELRGTPNDPQMRGLNLGAWGELWLEQRAETHRDAEGDRARWGTYVAPSSLAAVRLDALTAAMVSHRPAEARDVAAALRRRVPAKFRDKGFLSELVAMLEKAGKA